jgi:hypothetical protein
MDALCREFLLQYSTLEKKQDALEKPLYLVNFNVSDWDSISTPGWYSGKTTKNSPDGGNKWLQALLLLTNNNAKYLFVVAFSEAHIYIRTMNNGTWNSWTTIV